MSNPSNTHHSKPRPESQPDGMLYLDKPAGITSHRLVSMTRKALSIKRVGHAGTLDPMATGLVLLGVGPYTRLLTYLVGLDKEYVATIRLGAASSTDDADGEVTYTSPVVDEAVDAASVLITEKEPQIRDGIKKLTGQIFQTPSSVSAIKVDGKRAYQRVREGEEVTLKPRQVTIYECEIVDIEPGHVADGEETFSVIDVSVRVLCSSGTYIRAIARDLGKFTGLSGHLTMLRRTQIGPVTVADAHQNVDNLSAHYMTTANNLATQLFEWAELTEDQAQIVSHGGSLKDTDLLFNQPTAAKHQRRRTRTTSDGTEAEPIALLFHNQLIALATTTSGKIKPVTVFQPA